MGRNKKKRLRSRLGPAARFPKENGTTIGRESQGKAFCTRDRLMQFGAERSAFPTGVGINSRRTLRALATGGWSGFGALGMDGFGGLALADFGRADFVGGGVAGALEGAPHVPTGDGAVGTPAFTEGEKLLGLGHVLFAVGDG